MFYFFLDESSDLGHYVQSPGSSRHFVITIMEAAGDEARKAIAKAVERTLKNKINLSHSPQKKTTNELKATNTTLAVKQYFYRQIEEVPFRLYTVILDKARFENHQQFSQHRLYRFITHLVLKELPLEILSATVSLVLDRRTGGASVQEFNKSLRLQLEERIPPHVPLYIDHRDSSATRPLQAVDLFAWGIFRKYEVGDTAWYEVFREKVQFERVYPDK